MSRQNLHMNKEAFLNLIFSIMLEKFPNHVMVPANNLHVTIDGKHCNLENLYKTINLEAEDPNFNISSYIIQYINYLLESENVIEDMPKKEYIDRLMPRIQHKNIGHHVDMNKLAHIPYLNDCVICFVIDMANSVVSVDKEDLKKRNITLRDAERLSLDNLENLYSLYDQYCVTHTDNAACIVINQNTSYDSCAILSNIVYNNIRKIFHSHTFNVFIPNRDVFIASTDLKQAANMSITAYNTLPYPITSQGFVRSMDGVSELV